MFLHVGERVGQPPTLQLSGELADVFRQSALADAIDKKVTVRLATKSNEAFMAIPFRTFTTLQFGERIPSQSNTENRESAKLCVVAGTPTATPLMRRSPNPDISNQPFRSASCFDPPNLASAGKASMSLSGSIDIAFSQKEAKHHWKCPMYLANFRVCPF
jgi:hypothetical protein